MSWWNAWGYGGSWVSAAGLVAFAGAYWIRYLAPARLASYHVALVNLILGLIPFIVPPVAGAVHGSWRVALAAGLLELPVGWALFRLMGASLDAKSLDRHLERRRRSARLPSLSVGIVTRQGLVHARSFGLADCKQKRAATADTLYHIGSVTKVFTTTLLAMLRDRNLVRLEDRVADHLPPDVRLPTDPRGAPAITLRHLGTHSSGLPRLPANLKAKGDDPYGGYTVAELYAGLAQTALDFPTGARESYSNLGMGLLGHVLERAAGMPYEPLLKEWLFQPLGMMHSTITIAEEHRDRLAQGYREDDPQAEAPDWDLGCLVPAGGIISSVNDLAKFVALQLRAGQADVTPVAGSTLAELHAPQRLGEDWELAVGLGWYIARHGGLGNVVWHNGATAGHASFIAFVPRFQVGVIALTNCGACVDAIGKWLVEEAVQMFGREPRPDVDPRLRDTAHALGRYITPEPPDAVAEIFHDDFLAEVPADQVKQVFKSLYQECGACDGVAVFPGGAPRQATVLFRFAQGRTRACDIEVDGAAQPKILYAQFH
jgi:CubicO group peptidase (beta-lactamase class C family)